jgi:glycosyltransferase involved in cell wall biosynthesis
VKIVYTMPAFMLCGGVVHHCFVIPRLVARGHEVSVYAPVIQDTALLPVLPESVPLVRHRKVRSNLYTLPSEKSPLAFLRTLNDLTVGIYRMAEELPADADVVQATFYPNVYAAVRMKYRKKSRAAVLQGIHIDPEIFLPMSFRRRYSWLWAGAPRQADGLLTVCESLKDKLETRYKKPVWNVSNGVDDEILSGPDQGRDIVEKILDTGGRPYVLFIGSLTGRKGIDILLEAFSQIRQKYPDLLLALIGGGNWETYYKGLAARLGVLEHVRHRPGADRPMIRQVLDYASCFAFPSRAEGFGLPPLEAMARGVPVICTPCEGISEYAQGGFNCLQVPPESPPAVARAIEKALQGGPEIEKISENARETAQKFTWDRVADLTEKAMLEAVNARRY